MKSIRRFAVTLFAMAALGIMPSTAWGSASLFVTGGSDPDLTFEAAEYPFDITGERYESGPLKGATTLIETAKGYAFSCGVAEFDGGEISEGTADLALEATYSKCSSEGGQSFSVSMNACHYEYSGLEYRTGYDYDVVAEIVCDQGKEIILTSSSCTVKIPPQVLNDETEIRNIQFEGDDSANVATRNTGVDYSAHGNLFPCAAWGTPPGSYGDGASESDFVLSGLSLTGGPPKLEAEAYPSDISGQRFEDGELKGPIKLLAVGQYAMTCGAVGVDGGELWAPASAFTLDAAYSECTGSSAEKWAFSVGMNGCDYRYSDFEYRAADEFFASAEIVCPTGQKIELKGTAGCVVSVPPQSLGQESGIGNWKFKSGKESVVLVMEANSTVEYTSNSLACAAYYGIPVGTYSNGTTQVMVQLEGTPS